MNPEIQTYLESFDETTRERFNLLYHLILESAPAEVEEKLWAKLPSFSRGKHFVRLIPFKDHINIEAKGIAAYQDQLTGWKMTPKGMLQIGHQQAIPAELLKLVFKATLESAEAR